MDERIKNLLTDLGHQDERTRQLSAASLGDWLVYACRDGTGVKPVVTALTEALLREQDPDVQEEIAHSLAVLAEVGHMPVPLEIIHPLKVRLPELDPGAAEHIDAVLEAATWPES